MVSKVGGMIGWINVMFYFSYKSLQRKKWIFHLLVNLKTQSLKLDKTDLPKKKLDKTDLPKKKLDKTDKIQKMCQNPLF